MRGELNLTAPPSWESIELTPRVAVSSLLDLESKYNRAIEEKTLLEQEVITGQELEAECQRLKDDVRGECHDLLPAILAMLMP
jgi:hypothetical protein